MASPEAAAQVRATFLFTDIEGSTRLVHRLGDAWLPVLQQHDGVLRDAFGRRGGREVKSEGDALFVVFDDPVAAVEACVDAQRALAETDWVCADVAPDARIRVRMGLHTGRAFPVGDDFVGLAVHEAARVSSAGHGGQIVVSEETEAAVRGALTDGIELRDLGEHALKDFPPQRLFQVVHPDLDRTFPPLKTLTGTDHNLATPPTPLVGRGSEMLRIEELLLSDERLVTIVGSGGIGKTRLALDAARSLLVWFRGGAWWVDLAGLDDPGGIASVIAGALGVEEGSGGSVVDDVVARLAGAPTLLVLDNLEHLLDGVVVVADLLAACPDLKVLATSRGALRLRGEHRVELPPLEVDDAHRLFVERARAIVADFGAEEHEHDAVTEVVDRLDGIPLALELAAARLADLGIDGIVAGLSAALDLLTEGQRDLPPRQLTMRAALGWSRDQLDAEGQVAFDALGAFAGGVDPEGLAEVSGVAADSAVQHLVGAGLAQRAESGRLLVHEVVRQYAAEQLAASERERAAHDAHRDWLTAISDTLEEHARGVDLAAAIRRARLEGDNVAAAVGRDPARCAALVASFSWVWLVSGQLTVGDRMTRLVLEGASPGPDLSLVMVRAASFRRLLGRRDEAVALLEEAMVRAASDGHVLVEAEAANVLGDERRQAGDVDGAESLLASMLARVADDPSVWGRSVRARLLSSLAGVMVDRGQLDDAVELFERAIGVQESLGNRRQRGVIHANLAETHRARGALVEAAAHATKALDAARELDDPHMMATALLNLGVIRVSEGDHGQAVDALEEAYQLAGDLGARRLEAEVAYTLGVCLVQTDELRRAARLLSDAIDWLETEGAARVVRPLAVLASVHRDLGEEAAEVQVLGRLCVAAAEAGADEIGAWASGRLAELGG